jgi:hypothetical protein
MEHRMRTIGRHDINSLPLVLAGAARWARPDVEPPAN